MIDKDFYKRYGKSTYEVIDYNPIFKTYCMPIVKWVNDEPVVTYNFIRFCRN